MLNPNLNLSPNPTFGPSLNPETGLWSEEKCSICYLICNKCEHTEWEGKMRTLHRNLNFKRCYIKTKRKWTKRRGQKRPRWHHWSPRSALGDCLWVLAPFPKFLWRISRDDLWRWALIPLLSWFMCSFISSLSQTSLRSPSQHFTCPHTQRGATSIKPLWRVIVLSMIKSISVGAVRYDVWGDVLRLGRCTHIQAGSYLPACAICCSGDRVDLHNHAVVTITFKADYFCLGR